VLEPRFGADVFATLLSIPATKTLLRRHLSTHFVALIGNAVQQQKRELEAIPGYLPLTLGQKVKVCAQRSHHCLLYGLWDRKSRYVYSGLTIAYFTDCELSFQCLSNLLISKVIIILMLRFLLMQPHGEEFYAVWFISADSTSRRGVLCCLIYFCRFNLMERSYVLSDSFLLIQPQGEEFYAVWFISADSTSFRGVLCCLIYFYWFNLMERSSVLSDLFLLIQPHGEEFMLYDLFEISLCQPERYHRKTAFLIHNGLHGILCISTGDVIVRFVNRL